MSGWVGRVKKKTTDNDGRESDDEMRRGNQKEGRGDSQVRERECTEKKNHQES